MIYLQSTWYILFQSNSTPGLFFFFVGLTLEIVTLCFNGALKVYRAQPHCCLNVRHVRGSIVKGARFCGWVQSF